MTHHWLGTLGLLLLGFGLFSPSSVRAAEDLDTLFMVGGEKIAGRLTGLDKNTFRLQKPLPPPANASADTPPIFATVTIPRSDVDYVVFAADPKREALLKTATLDQLPTLEALWESQSPWLGVARSPAADVGLAYGDLLLRSDDPAKARLALSLFEKIEKGTWNSDVDMRARQGRLRAMVATGQAKNAVAEASELAKISEDPAVLNEAKFILAEAADQELRQLVEDNPRWTEDIYVIPERHRLYNEALDLYLHPSLFFGSEMIPAARGLWGAVGVYQFTDEMPKAVEVARDLVAIYPGTKFATLAQNFLDGLPEELKAQDNERAAREAVAGESNPEAEPPQPSTESPKNNEK